jgi:glycosyltransferase involved in cell wall biosynthesis
MRIGLDARSMTLPRPRGTGRNLLDAYRLIPRLRPEWEFVLYHQRRLAENAHDEHPVWREPNVRLRRIDMPGDRFDAWFQARLPLAIRRDRLDLMHFPANAAPAWCPAPCVVTIHDLAPLRLQGELSPGDTSAFRRGVLRATRRAARIITVSAATREELCRDFGMSPDRVTVIPWAADHGIVRAAREPLSAVQNEDLRRRYGLGPRWLLTFSGNSRRKNARGVLDGFARVSPDARRGVQVVLVGCTSADYRATLAASAERAGISDQCRILDFVPYEDLPALLRGASGLLMPSRCEGFGLPILDAFACGVPVLTSRISSMPEVAGDAAAYCDPNDPQTIAAGIEQLLDRASAEVLVRRGRERLRLFSWERTAAAMCRAYETAWEAVRGGVRPEVVHA